MADTFDFGGQTFRAGSVDIAMSSNPELDGAGEPWVDFVRWNLKIRLVKTTLSSVKDQTTALESAFSQTRAYAKLFESDGSTETAHVLGPTGIIGGVRVVRRPSYASLKNGEAVTFRNVEVTLEACVNLSPSAYHIVDMKEQVPQQASGARTAAIQPNIGPAILQQVRTQQLSVYTQSGSITYAGTYGPIPPPQFADSFRVAEPRLTPYSPRTIGRGVYRGEIGFRIDYSYEFVGPSTLAGLPTRWIA